MPIVSNYAVLESQKEEGLLRETLESHHLSEKTKQG